MQPKSSKNAWISSSVLKAMTTEAERTLPYETGGCLMGYWSENHEEVVITEIVGPGPKAKHNKSKFEPDHEWQTDKISEIYKKSGCIHTYLGDWHTHPSSPNILSWRDCWTLRKIANYPYARAPAPTMGILADNSAWVLKIWFLDIRNLRNVFLGKCHEIKEIRVYD